MEAVQVPVTVSLDESSYHKLLGLIPGDLPPAKKIEGFANGLVEDICQGGLMLSGDDVSRIREVSPNAGPEEIISAVGDSGGMEDGQIKVPFYLDPTLLGPLKDIAEMQGFSVQEVVQNMMDHAIEQGWFYALEPQPKCLFLEQDDYHQLAKVMGKGSPTGADLMEWLKQNGLAEETVADVNKLFQEADASGEAGQLQLEDNKPAEPVTA